MRAIIFLVALVLILALVGWISFSNSPDRSTINLETQQIKQDTERIMDSGSELLREAGSTVDAPKEEEVVVPNDPATTDPATTGTPVPPATR